MSTDECSSTESGWTTYIASSPDKEDDPTRDEDDEDKCGSSMDTEGVNQHESKDYDDDADADANTDDSMASDASSGPSNKKRSSNAGKKNERKSYCSEKCKQEKKKIGEIIKVEEEKSETKGNRGEISVKK